MNPTTMDAEFSGDRLYRYRLWRTWDEARPPLGYVMLNPSTANEKFDDPTVVRCVERARRLGYGGVEIGNLYACRATYPRDLWKAPDPVGTLNDRYLNDLAERCRDVVLAWGIHAESARAQAVVGVLRAANPDGIRLLHLGLTKDGQPRHPLHTAYAVPFREFPR